ncbi:MAG TPA: hypothetical protein VHK69_18475 [Chitinophagaceae bacterium]|jgi:hypothetical protein|nr:hypothetical protein [Chitinophagaceae bacterium]
MRRTATLLLAFGAILGCNTQDKATHAEKLTSGTWIYTEYYFKQGHNGKELTFKRGRSENDLDLTKNQVTFQKDGTVKEIDQFGYSHPGTWRFLEEGKKVEVKNETGTYISEIATLTTDTFEFIDHNNNTRGKLAH